jgi:mercuric ion binding protein
MKRIPVLVVGTVVALVAVAALWTDRSAPAQEPATAAVVAANLETKVFRVEHMTCATCPIAVKTAMSRVTGVASVDVDFESKTAKVSFDPGVATPEQIAAASTNAGYPASPAS